MILRASWIKRAIAIQSVNDCLEVEAQRIQEARDDISVSPSSTLSCSYYNKYCNKLTFQAETLALVDGTRALVDETGVLVKEIHVKMEQLELTGAPSTLVRYMQTYSMHAIIRANQIKQHHQCYQRIASKTRCLPMVVTNLSMQQSTFSSMQAPHGLQYSERVVWARPQSHWPSRTPIPSLTTLGMDVFSFPVKRFPTPILSLLHWPTCLLSRAQRSFIHGYISSQGKVENVTHTRQLRDRQASRRRYQGACYRAIARDTGEDSVIIAHHHVPRECSSTALSMVEFRLRGPDAVLARSGNANIRRYG